MKKNPLPKQYLYEFNCPNKVFSDLKNFSKLINWDKACKRININKFEGGMTYFGSDSSLSNETTLENLHKWIENCLYKIKKDIINYDQNFEKLSISQSWLNLSKKGQIHHEHTHPLSILSGIIYLTENCSTTFYLKSIYDNPLILPNKNFEEKIDHFGKKGSLIIFPSNLKHSVGPHLYSNDRITFSFNSWFKGSLGDKNNGSYIPRIF